MRGSSHDHALVNSDEPAGQRHYRRAVQTMVAAGADRIWAEDSGGSGPVLVLLHAGVADARMWEPVWPELTATFRVIRFDCRGYGRSPAATEEYTLLGDLRAVLEHFGVETVHLAGCSQGGRTALEFALAEPHQLGSLFLLCPGIGGFPYPAMPELEAECEALAAAGDDDGIVSVLLTVWGAAGPDQFVTELMRSAMRAWEAEERFLREDDTLLGRLGDVLAPTVIMVGDKDYPPLVASNEVAAERIPGCRLITMPGVDHYPTVREPKLVAQAILAHCGASC